MRRLTGIVTTVLLAAATGSASTAAPGLRAESCADVSCFRLESTIACLLANWGELRVEG